MFSHSEKLSTEEKQNKMFGGSYELLQQIKNLSSAQ
jgi:hypothetical protein